MQDRISAYPGRVKLKPVAGQADTYDLTRADQPTQEGTPLNKAALLSDTTVNALKSGYSDWPDNADTVTPDDALARIMWLKGQAGGFASLDAMGKLMYDQIPSELNPLPWEYIAATDYGDTYPLDLSAKKYYVTCTSDGMAMMFNFTISAADTRGCVVFVGDIGMPANITLGANVNVTEAKGQASLSGNTLSVSGIYGSLQYGVVLRFVGGQNGLIAVTEPLFASSGTISSTYLAKPSVQTTGTSLNLSTYDYAFNATSKTATITALPSAGVSNAIYFYGSAWATGEAMSAGDVIKLTNSSGKTIQLSTAQTYMTYSGNVLTITPHGYRDENCIGICLRFVRASSYSRPFITKLYQ